MESRSDFYVAVLTAVPVLWLTAGLAAGSLRRIATTVWRRRFSVELSVPSPFGVFGPIGWITFAPDRAYFTLRWFAFLLGRRELTLLRSSGRSLTSAGLLSSAAFIFVSSGAVAQVISLLALFNTWTGTGVAVATLVAALLVVGMAVPIVAVSLTTSLGLAGVSQDPGDEEAEVA